MLKCKKIAVGLFTLLLALGCSSKTETSTENRVVIRVDNRVLTLAEFNEYFEPISMSFGKDEAENSEAIREARLRFLLQLVEEMIILKRADELHLDISLQELDEAVGDFQKDYPEGSFEDLFLRQAVSFEVWKKRLKRRLLVEKVMRKELLNEDSVTPQEIKDYYEKHQEEWRHGEGLRARHILLPTEEQAKYISQQLKDGGDFATLARAHSIGPEALQGGDMGYVVRGQLPSSLEEPLFNLQPGDVSSVIKTPYGFHIFQVIEKSEMTQPNIEESIDQIKNAIQQERIETAYGPWLDKLRSRYHIEVNKEIIG